MSSSNKADLFLDFVSTLVDVNISPKLGLAIIDIFEVDDDMRAHADLMKEWKHWTNAARATAALNLTPGTSTSDDTKNHIGDVYAQYFMLTGSVATPRYNLCIALMKFATHQTLHAFGSTQGLPYPNADGTRDYATPGPAIESAYFGHNEIEDSVANLWPEFLRETAERLDFDFDAML